MSNTQVADDTKYLFKRDKTWWVKLAVPRKFRSILGYDLRRSLHTEDIDVAREARSAAIDELRDKIDAVKAGKTGEVDSQDATEDAKQGLRQVDQLIVADNDHEVMIPAVKAFFRGIDFQRRRIDVDLPGGLREINAV